MAARTWANGNWRKRAAADPWNRRGLFDDATDAALSEDIDWPAWHLTPLSSYRYSSILGSRSIYGGGSDDVMDVFISTRPTEGWREITSGPQ